MMDIYIRIISIIRTINNRNTRSHTQPSLVIYFFSWRIDAYDAERRQMMKIFPQEWERE